MLKEASYLRFLVEAYHGAKADFENDAAHCFDSVEGLRTFHAGIVRSFLTRTLARFPGARRLVLKEPHLTQHFSRTFSSGSPAPDSCGSSGTRGASSRP